jgi:hypothetical protein
MNWKDNEKFIESATIYICLLLSVGLALSVVVHIMVMLRPHEKSEPERWTRCVNACGARP